MRLTTLPLILLGTACVTQSPVDNDEAVPLPDEEVLTSAEGSYGRIWMNTPDGPVLVTYQVKNGHAIHEGDVDLGPVHALRERGGAANLAERWPDGIVYYAFDDSFDEQQVCHIGFTECVTSKARVRATLAAIEEKLPLEFRELTSFEELQNSDGVILFEYEAGMDTPGSASHIGRSGGIQTIKFRTGHDNPDPPYYHSQPTQGTIRHEVLHAVGLWHEQGRSDRDQFVTVDYNCIIDGTGNNNYDRHLNSADLGPYDFNSIMHYSAEAQCIEDASMECICPPMTPIPPGAVIARESGRGGFSIEDTNTLYRMYAEPHGVNWTSERYGSALAAGDFDNDGYTDLAVGVPDEDLASGAWMNPTTVANAGRVHIWKGTPGGLVAWTIVAQDRFANQSLTANATFGTALVAADLNGDGVTDLAIGAPGARSGAGAVYIMRGTEDLGLAPHRVLSQASHSADDEVDGDRFGETLAAGPLTGVRDSCTGHLVASLAVGAPGDYVPTLFGGSSRLGSVFLFQETRTPSTSGNCGTSTRLHKPTVVTHNVFSHPGALSTDQFATALAIGYLDGDLRADLAIGAPGHASGDGKVYLYAGRLPPEAPASWSSMVTTPAIDDELVGPRTATRFGAALAIATGSGSEIAVGAPGGAGQALVYRNQGGVLALTKTITSAVVEAGDEFGATVAIGNIETTYGNVDYVIGAPGEDSDRGAVTLVRWDGVRAELLQTDIPGGDRDAGDRFGASLAIGSFNGDESRHTAEKSPPRYADLAVGAPGEKPELFPYVDDDAASGAVDVYRGRSSGFVHAWHQRHQEIAGQLADP